MSIIIICESGKIPDSILGKILIIFDSDLIFKLKIIVIVAMVICLNILLIYIPIS